MNLCSVDLDKAIRSILNNLKGIESLYTGQLELLSCLLQEDSNIFYTSSTNSGKTLPTVILPSIMKELNTLGYCFPKNPKVLFLTALNSIQMSLMVTMEKIGVACESLNSENAKYLLKNGPDVIFISPETLKISEVTRVLLEHRSDFVLKIIDEAHLGKI